ncbi:MAG: SPL family radical SAM protein, partial [Pollutimonas bauzanensis]
IPTGVIVAPVIPSLTDHDMEKILFSAKDAGARNAAYVLLRLPLEIADLFREWLAAHHPLKEAHVMNLVKQMRGGKIYDPDFKTRMRGTGVFADLLEQRFRRACAKAGLNQTRHVLSTDLFRPPPEDQPQLKLF